MKIIVIEICAILCLLRGVTYGEEEGEKVAEALRTALASEYEEYKDIRENMIAEMEKNRKLYLDISLSRSFNEEIVRRAWLIRSIDIKEAEEFDTLINKGRRIWSDYDRGSNRRTIDEGKAWHSIKDKFTSDEIDRFVVPLLSEMVLMDRRERSAWMWVAVYSRREAFMSLIVYFYVYSELGYSKRDIERIFKWISTGCKYGRIKFESPVDDYNRPVPILLKVYKETKDSGFRCRIIEKIGEIGFNKDVDKVRELAVREKNKNVVRSLNKVIIKIKKRGASGYPVPVQRQ